MVRINERTCYSPAHRGRPTHPTPRHSIPDFHKKLIVEVGGMTPAQIEDKVREMVVSGDAQPRSYQQSIKPLVLPSVVD